MLYLAIESSCDETSLAFLEYTPTDSDQNADQSFYNKINSIKIISSIISSQIAIHSQYGGVVPEIGAREHAEQIHGLFDIVLQESMTKLSQTKSQILGQLSAIMVTTEPGLMSALRVGLGFGKSLQFFVSQNHNNYIEIVKVNHLKGHVFSSFYETIKVDYQNQSYKNQDIFPHLHLLVSGGNTQIRLLHSFDSWEIVGQTLDDACGECFDKTARMVGIPYPGGATVSHIAGLSLDNPLDLPIGMIKNKNLDISLSGLKTAVRYKVENKIKEGTVEGLEFEKPLSVQEIDSLKANNFEIDNTKLKFIQEICISTQSAIIKQITNKLELAIMTHKPKSLGLSGGVSANPLLKQEVYRLASKHSNKIVSKPTPVFIPDLSLTGDNAIMIGLAGICELD